MPLYKKKNDKNEDECIMETDGLGFIAFVLVIFVIGLWLGAYISS